MSTEYITLGELPQSFTEVLMRFFSDYSVALGRVRNEKAEEFRPLGSGVLIKRGSRYGILTAHHCLHACKPPVELGPSGCDTLSLIIKGGRGVLIKPYEAIEHILVEPKLAAFGPDLTFIEIFGDALATVRAVGSFWPLDKIPDEIIKIFGTEGTPIVTIGFPQVDYRSCEAGGRGLICPYGTSRRPDTKNEVSFNALSYLFLSSGQRTSPCAPFDWP